MKSPISTRAYAGAQAVHDHDECPPSTGGTRGGVRLATQVTLDKGWSSIAPAPVLESVNPIITRTVGATRHPDHAHKNKIQLDNRRPHLLVSPYIASKGALIGAMRKLARTLGPDGISVTAVAPGLAETPGTVNKDAEFADVVNRQALKRRLTPDDTAATVAFLVSDDAAALTGQELCVDGGLILR